MAPPCSGLCIGKVKLRPLLVAIASRTLERASAGSLRRHLSPSSLMQASQKNQDLLRRAPSIHPPLSLTASPPWNSCRHRILNRTSSKLHLSSINHSPLSCCS